MNRWRKPIPLERIWSSDCLAVRSLNEWLSDDVPLWPQRSETTELLIVLSEAARQSLRAGLIEDGSTIITQMLVDIDVEEAKAEQESDHRQLSVRFHM